MSKEEFYSNEIDLSNENEVNNLIIKNQERTITKLKEENKILKDKIDKAIEYIKETACYITDGKNKEMCVDDINYDECMELLDILRGENK